MKKRLTLLLVFLCIWLGWLNGQINVFTDDFSSNTNTNWTTGGQIGSSYWYVNRSGDDWGARRNTSPEQLELTNDASVTTPNANGWVFAYVDANTVFQAPFSTTLSSNINTVSWYFNMQQIRTDPSGFGSGYYGVAFIIAGSSNSPNSNGNGYAVVLGQSGSSDPVRLAKFNNGLS